MDNTIVFNQYISFTLEALYFEKWGIRFLSFWLGTERTSRFNPKIYEKFNITKDSEVPEISRFDPVAQAIGLRPGQLCKITRSSPTSITTEFYRFCVQ